MRIIIAITTIIVIISSCEDSSQRKTDRDQVPKALQEESADVSLISKRSGNDLVESLYDELVAKDKDLKDLENEIADLKKNDFTAAFTIYDQKNKSYYSSSETYISQIKDSMLKERISVIVHKSTDAYSRQTASYKSLQEKLDSKFALLSDLHYILKLTSTLPLIEKYQKENMPSTKPVENVLKEVDETIKKVDAASKK